MLESLRRAISDDLSFFIFLIVILLLIRYAQQVINVLAVIGGLVIQLLTLAFRIAKVIVAASIIVFGLSAYNEGDVRTMSLAAVGVAAGFSQIASSLMQITDDQNDKSALKSISFGAAMIAMLFLGVLAFETGHSNDRIGWFKEICKFLSSTCWTTATCLSVVCSMNMIDVTSKHVKDIKTSL